MSLPVESLPKDAAQPTVQNPRDNEFFEVLCTQLEEAVQSRQKAVEALGKVQEARKETERQRAEAE